MQYEFSIGTFFVGILILVASAAFVRWHQVIADNMASGVSSYDRFKMWGLIGCGVGLLVMVNLHTFILVNLLKSVFPGIG